MVRVLVCEPARAGIRENHLENSRQSRRADVREERVRTIREIAANYLESYRLRNPRSATFAEYAVGHVTRILGDKMLVDANEQTVKHYQEHGSAKTLHPNQSMRKLAFSSV